MKSNGISGKIAGFFSKKEEEYESTTDNFTVDISKYEKNDKGKMVNKVTLSSGRYFNYNCPKIIFIFYFLSGSWVSFL